MSQTLKVRVRENLITATNGYRAGFEYDVETPIALDMCKHGQAELVPQERTTKQAIAKPRSKRGK